MKCSHCGGELQESDCYCPYCGRPVVVKKKRKYRILGIVAFVAVLFFVAALVFWKDSLPKGMYEMHDPQGKMIASLSLRKDGTYVLQDEQDYTVGKQDNAIVFAHHFRITDEGLTWDKKETGRFRSSHEKNIYEIDDFTGGLYDRKKDMYVFDAGSVIYLYEKDNPDSQIWVMSKI